MARERLPLPRGPDGRDRMERIFSARGRPEGRDGYRLPATEGRDPGSAREAAKWLHAVGLSRSQAKALTESWNVCEHDHGPERVHLRVRASVEIAI